MAKFFFGDITRNHENFYKKHVFADTPFYLKVKSHPGDGVDLLHKIRLNKSVNEQNEAAYSISNGATAKYGFSTANQKIKFGNDSASFEISNKPKELNKDDLKFEHKHAATYRPSDNYYDTTHSLKVGSPDLSGAKLWFTFDFVYKRTKAIALKPSLNIWYSDVNLGVKAEHDTKVLKAAEGQLAWSNKDIFAFVKGNNKKEITTGFNWKQSSDYQHFFQAMYDVNKKVDGAFGQPMILQVGSSGKFNDVLKFKAFAQVSKDVVLKSSQEQIIDDKLTFVFSETFNATQWRADPTKGNYSFGFEAEYHL